MQVAAGEMPAAGKQDTGMAYPSRGVGNG